MAKLMLRSLFRLYGFLIRMNLAVFDRFMTHFVLVFFDDKCAYRAETEALQSLCG
jgi:hypothetical protein